MKMAVVGSDVVHQAHEWKEEPSARTQGRRKDCMDRDLPSIRPKWKMVPCWAWASVTVVLCYPLGQFFLPSTWTRLYATDVPYLCLGRAALLSFVTVLFLTCGGYLAMVVDARSKRKQRDLKDTVRGVRLVKHTALLLSWGWFFMHLFRYEVIHGDGSQWLTAHANNTLWLHARRLLYNVAVVASWPTLLNLAFVCISADRFGILYLLTGYPYTLVRYLHHFASKQLVFWCSLHSILPPLLWLSVSKATFSSHLLDLSSRYTGAVVNFSGLVSYCFLLILWVTSSDLVRRKQYEHFQIFHFFSVGFLFFAQLHDYETFHYAHAGLVLLISDVLYRKLALQDRMRVQPSRNGHIKLSHVTRPLLAPRAGQSIELKVPEVSNQFHPLSVSGVEEDGFEVTVFEKGDWTRAVLQHISRMNADEHGEAVIQGPFGRSEIAFTNEQDVVVIAGGSGLAAFAASIASFCSSEKSGKLSILWLVKTHQDYARFHHLLQFASETGATVRVNIRCPLELEVRESQDKTLCLEEELGEMSNLEQDAVQRAGRQGPTVSEYRNHCFKGLVTLATFVGSVVGFVVARLVACKKSGTGGTHCRFLWKGESCSVCKTLGHCKIWSCWLAFRGFPILFSVCAAVGFGAWGAWIMKRNSLVGQESVPEENDKLLGGSTEDPGIDAGRTRVTFLYDRFCLQHLVALCVDGRSAVHVCGPQGFSTDVYTAVHKMKHQKCDFICHTYP